MGIFNLTDIRVSTDSSRPGVGKKLLKGTDGYNSNIYRYPLDIGGADKGHYLVIHINAQDETKWGNKYHTDKPTIFQRGGTPALYTNVSNSANGVQSIVTQGVNAVTETISGVSTEIGNKLTDITGVVGAIANTVIKSYTSGKTARTIKRTTDTVVLYMPDTVTFTNTQSYSELSLQGKIAAAAAGGSSLADLLNKSANGENIGRALGNIAPYIVNNLSQSSDATRALFAAGTGFVQNPMLEVIYSSPAFRTFSFDFLMYPRSKKESEEMMKLIERLRFHQAPEVHSKFNGFFLVPPSEFDIKFYCNGEENPNIDRISTCVLESISVDYAPSGFSAYEIPSEMSPTVGGTGAPVAVQLTLQFKELQILTKDDYSGASTRGKL